MKKIYKILAKILVSLILLFTLSVIPSAIAGTTGGELESQLQKAGGSWGGVRPLGSASLTGIVATVVKVFLGLLGIIFLILIIYAGFMWMTAAGDEEKVTKAKDTLQRAVIGLIIITAAYSITYFVFKALPGSDGSDLNITTE